MIATILYRKTIFKSSPTWLN